MSSAPETPAQPIREDTLVAAFRRFARDHAAVRIGIGDDAAMLAVPDGVVLVTADMLLDGVHFDTRTHDWGRIGRKAINCSLSDCAAMAAQPAAATVSLALPESMSEDAVLTLFRAMTKAAGAFECVIIGGDLTRWPHPLAIDVAMLARPNATRGPVCRNGALVGDFVGVTGRLGGSCAGHHLDFTPRVNEAARLADELGERLHAMMDISDGLSIDLHRLCAASGVGAVVDEALLKPVASEDAHRLAAADRRSVIDHVLNDGEDFELLVCIDPANCDVAGRCGVTIIGEITERGITLRTIDGGLQAIEPRGYDHFSSRR